MTDPRQPHLVIVDDEKSYVDLLSTLLEDRLDCPISTFVRPSAALEALATIAVGIIVTDYCMPEMDGIAFLHAALKLQPDTPCIMITGHSTALDSMKLDNLPELHRVMAKPFRGRDLAECILEVWPEAAKRPSA